MVCRQRREIMCEVDLLDILDINNCAIRDENGNILAHLMEDNGVVIVIRDAACSLGMYFYILGYLRELGFEVR